MHFFLARGHTPIDSVNESEFAGNKRAKGFGVDIFREGKCGPTWCHVKTVKFEFLVGE